MSTRGIVQVGIVYWEEEERERVVHTFCRRCQASLRSAGEPEMARIGDVNIVSPKGVAHAGSWWMTDGVTACGIDGTGDDWWWRI